jgi:hypothetical protein
LHSADFIDAGGLTWRLKLVPNHQRTHMGVFLEADGKSLPDGGASFWSRPTFFRIGHRFPQQEDTDSTTDGRFDSSKYKWLDLEKNFAYKKGGEDRGFWNFASFKDMREKTDKETNLIEIATEINEVIPYDSQKRTGMVGLKNQGATCYMNSLLQTLYHCNKLRLAVYDMPTEDEQDETKSLALALQRVFWRLQTSKEAVSTRELTQSFGWNGSESFQQQDVQELNRVLCDKLEEKMTGTCVEGTIKHLFEGQVCVYWHACYYFCFNFPIFFRMSPPSPKLSRIL